MDPATTIALIAACVGAATTGLNKLLVDQDRVEEIRKRLKEIQKEMKEEKGKEQPKKQKEMMQLSKEMMLNNFKPMIFTLIPILILIFFLKGMYGEAGVVVTLPILNIGLTWLWWYILISIIVSMTLEGIYKAWRKRNKED